MTPEHRQWKKSILTGGALCAAWWPYPPFIWNNSTFLGLNLFILIWTTPHGLNVTSAIPPFIYSVGTWESVHVVRSRHFLCTFFCCRQFLLPPPPFLFHLICLFFLKMGQKPYCPNGGKDKSKKKKKKDTDTDQTKRNTTDQEKKPTTSPGGGSAHKDQSTGNFTADVMAACIEEIKRVEAEVAVKGEQPKIVLE